MTHQRIMVITATMIASLSTLAIPASAGVLFEDDFDTDNPISVLNFDALINWTVSEGTIDYLRSGDFGISCLGGAGGCLDMGGSSSDAGRITTKSVFTFDPGVAYAIDVTISGNQLGGASDSITVGLIDDVTSTMVTAFFPPLPASAPFGTCTADFGTLSPGTWRLFVEGAGGDNVGIILDDLVLRGHAVADGRGITRHRRATRPTQVGERVYGI